MGNLSNINRQNEQVYAEAKQRTGAARPIPIDTVLVAKITRVEIKDAEAFKLGFEFTIDRGPWKGVTLWDWFAIGGDISDKQLNYGMGRWKGINEAVGNVRPADDTNQLIGKLLQFTVFDHEPNYKNPQYTDEKFGTFEAVANMPAQGSQTKIYNNDDDIPF